MLRVNRDLALKMEWENITAAMRAPKEVLTPLSESEKAKAFAPPTQRPQIESSQLGKFRLPMPQEHRSNRPWRTETAGLASNRTSEAGCRTSIH